MRLPKARAVRQWARLGLQKLKEEASAHQWEGRDCAVIHRDRARLWTTDDDPWLTIEESAADGRAEL